MYVYIYIYLFKSIRIGLDIAKTEKRKKEQKIIEQDHKTIQPKTKHKKTKNKIPLK